MSQGLLASLAEFFDVIGSHWYWVFNAKNGDAKDLLIQSTFPSLASLMKMERRFVQELFLEAGLLKTRLYHGAYIVHADWKLWDSFIHQNCLAMETTVFEPRNSKNLYIKVGKWNSSHPAVTPGKFWKDAVKLGFYNVPKLRISSAAMKVARNIGKQFTTSSLSLSNQSIRVAMIVQVPWKMCWRTKLVHHPMLPPILLLMIFQMHQNIPCFILMAWKSTMMR